MKLALVLVGFIFIFSIPLGYSSDNFEKLNENYVTYEISFDSPTVIEGRVISKETGEGVNNVKIDGEIPSDNFSLKIDNSGDFRIIIDNELSEENSEIHLETSAPGYENKTISKTINPGETEYILIELDYNPFDLNLSKNYDSLVREWVENSYIYKKIENFIDTRQVIDYYEYEPRYRIYSDFSFFSLPGAISDLKSYSGSTLEKLRFPNEDFWLDYCRTHVNGRVTNYSEEPNSFQTFYYGFQHFQGFTNWYVHGVHKPSYGGTYLVSVPHTYNFLAKSGVYEIPVYKQEEYTRWKITTYQITDYYLENWENKQITISTQFLNGYDSEVRLETSNEEFEIKKEENILTPSKTTSIFTITPHENTQNSTHTITIFGYDENNQLVENIEYELELSIKPKPPIENNILSIEEAEEKPDETGDIESRVNYRMGVEGWVFDQDTGDELSNGLTATVTVETKTDSASIKGNKYEWIWVGSTGHDTKWKMKITTDAANHIPKTGHATDKWNTYSIARKDFHLERQIEPPQI